MNRDESADDADDDEIGQQTVVLPVMRSASHPAGMPTSIHRPGVKHGGRMRSAQRLPDQVHDQRGKQRLELGWCRTSKFHLRPWAS